MKAAAHITGGGLPGNIVRVLPDSVAVDIDASSWTMPPVFGWISTVVMYLFTVGDVSDLTFPCTSHSTGESHTSDCLLMPTTSPQKRGRKFMSITSAHLNRFW